MLLSLRYQPASKRIGSDVTVAPVARLILAVLALVVSCSPSPPPPALPDLAVSAAQKPGYTCENGMLRFVISADIKNNGPGVAVLSDDWTKPWLTAYPSKPIPNFVQPYHTGKAVTLKPGESVTDEFPISLLSLAGGGAYDVIVEVDPKNAIPEANEGNNTAKIQIPAKICG